MAITRASWILFAALCGCGARQATTELATSGVGNAGLANAPKLGTYPTQEKPYDVIADGPESCEHEPGQPPRLWSRSPPCEAPVEATPALTPVPPPPPARPWVPRSRWSLPACATMTAREPLLVASCCPEDDLACAP